VSDEIILCAELTCYRRSLGATAVRRFATKSGVYGGNYYDGKLKDPGNFEIHAFSPGKTSGPSTIGFGEVLLSNTSGGLDNLMEDGLDGRSIVFKKFTVAAGLVLLTSCAMEQATHSGNNISVRIKDPQSVLNVPVQATRYAGTNTPPDGIEGTDDIKGRPKALTFGHVARDATHSSGNVTPVQVNTSKLIYHVGPVYDIPAAYDKGVALTRGADYTSQSDMEANPPLPANYRVWPAGGCFRLGSRPQGQVSADVIEGATAADRTAAQVAKRILAYAAPSVTVSAADVTALDAANSSEVGIFITDEMTIIEALDQVLGSVGAWYVFDEAMVLRIKRLEAPTGDPDVTISAAQVKDLSRMASSDEGAGLPAKQVNLQYGKNYTVQQAGDLGGSVIKPIWDTVTLSHQGAQGGAYGNGRYVVCFSTDNKVGVSFDGRVWQYVTLPSSGNTPWKAAFGNNVFVLVERNYGRIFTSPDGFTWTQQAQTNILLDDVTFGNDRFVAVGESLSASYSYVSTNDGVDWTSSSLLQYFSGCNWSIAYGEVDGSPHFLAVMYLSAGSTISVSSSDGATWAQRNISASGPWHNVHYGHGLYMAVASAYDDYRIIKSSDGENWTVQTIHPAPTGYGLVSCFYDEDNRRWLVSGGPSFQSPDGANWYTHDLIYGEIVKGDQQLLLMPGGSSYTVSIYSDYAPPENAQWRSQEYRSVTAGPDADVTTVHPLAPELNFTTLLAGAAAAQSEAAQRLDLHRFRRDPLKLVVDVSIAQYITPGKTLKLFYQSYGLAGGKQYVVLSTIVEWGIKNVTFDLWGPAYLPAAVTIAITSGTDVPVVLSWTDDINAAGYDIHRSTSSGFTPGAANKIGWTPAPFYSDAGAAPATTYYYKVVAIGDVNAAASNQVSVTTAP
jgi:hypothetical protein